MMKAIVIAGRLTKDAEPRTTQGGDKLTSFSVAVDDGFGQNKSTLFFDCSWFGKRGEAVSQMLTKGRQVTISGDFSTNEHNGKTYLKVRVNDLTLQGGGKRESDTQQGGGYAGGSTGGSPGRPDFDNEIPFSPCVLL